MDFASKLHALSNAVATITPLIPLEHSQIESEASRLLLFVQQQIQSLQEQPDVAWCAALFACLEVLTDFACSNFFPHAVASVRQLLAHVLSLPLSDVVIPSLSTSLKRLDGRLLSVQSLHSSSTTHGGGGLPFTMFWNARARHASSTVVTMPNENDYMEALHLSARPWSMPRITDAHVHIADYLQCLFASFKCSNVARVAQETRGALQHGSLNLYSVCGMHVGGGGGGGGDFPQRRGVHGSARWSIDVVMYVERLEEEEDREKEEAEEEEEGGNAKRVPSTWMVYSPERSRRSSSSSEQEDETKEMEVEEEDEEEDEQDGQDGENVFFDDFEDIMEDEESYSSKEKSSSPGGGRRGSGMGYALLVWSTTSSCDHLRGISIQKCEVVEEDDEDEDAAAAAASAASKQQQQQQQQHRQHRSSSSSSSSSSIKEAVLCRLCG